MTLSLARFLQEFELRPPTDQAILLPDQASDLQPAPEPSPEEMLAAQLAEAREAGRAEAAREAAATQVQREETLRAAQLQALQAERAAWCESEGQSLASGLRDAVAALETRIAGAVAGILAPLLPDMVARRTVDELRQAVEVLLSNENEPMILVSGRADLVSVMERHFGRVSRVRFASSDAPEVAVRAGDTEIRSELVAWAQHLASLWDAET